MRDCKACASGVGGFNAMHAISTRNDDPKTASRPFDKDRDGFVMAEGGGGVIFEELEHAIARGAKIYAEVAKQKLTMGRSIDSFVTASLYAAIRIHDFPRLLEEIVDVAMMPLRSVHRSLSLIVRMVFPVLKMKYKPISPEPLIFRFGNDLNLSVHVQKHAADILRNALRHGLKKMGKDPKGLASAALYLAAKQTKEKRTQTQIAEIARITEVTLRTRAKQIKANI